MNAFSLSIAYIRHQILSAGLNIIIFASGIAVIVMLLLINAQLQNEFTKHLKGIDLVAGSKGSPLQLILSSVFHMDIPTGNIPLEEAEKIKANPLIKSAIPVALGDNYKGFRIVGTTSDYIAHYGGTLAQGRAFNTEMEVVVGSEVAERNRLKTGDKIVGAHGLINSDDLHSDSPYSVVGILEPTNSILDRLVLTPLESVWHVHEHPDHDEAEEAGHHEEHHEKEITALLIKYKTPLAAVTLPKIINNSTSMQAASPAFEVARLNSFFNVGSETLRAFGWFLIALAGFSIFTSIYNAMNERKYHLALMRSFGASPGKLLVLVVMETLILTGAGSFLGLLAGHGLTSLMGCWLATTKHIALSGLVFLPEEMVLVFCSILAGTMAGLLPALKVYRLDIYKTLVGK